MNLPDRIRTTEHPVGSNGRIILTIGYFVIFLGLVNPLFWASIFQGKTTEIIAMNAIFSGLLVVFAVALVLVGRSHITKELRDDAEQESDSYDRRNDV